MREIKFRGKRIDTKSWVYGYLTTDVLFGAAYIKDGSWVHEVDPETVGQYTGLRDAKGKEIYEGDILASRLTLGEVAYEEKSAAYMVMKNTPIELRFYIHCGVEVIGNTHDKKD